MIYRFIVRAPLAALFVLALVAALLILWFVGPVALLASAT